MGKKLNFPKTLYKNLDMTEEELILDYFRALPNFRSRMKYYIEKRDILKESNLPYEYKVYLDLFGEDYIKSHYYSKHTLELEFKKRASSIKERIISEFPSIDDQCRPMFYSVQSVRRKLQMIYDEYNIPDGAKASDLDQYFDTKKTHLRINDEDQNGILIVGLCCI